jgi:hypothetical protein
MRFVTATEDGALCVTGRVVITAPHQALSYSVGVCWCNWSGAERG